jgi:septum site-determining protein MinC
MQSIHAETPTPASAGPALEVKGTITPVTVLCLRTRDVARIERELRARVEPAPQMFLNAPVVIDVADVEGDGAVPLGEILERVRGCKLVPVGVAHLPAEHVGLAAEVGLAIVQLGFGRSRAARAASSLPLPPPARPPVVAAPPPPPAVVAPPPEPPRAAAPAAAPTPEPAFTLTVRQPVRGGQVVYAQRGDLVVVAPVNPGAQVIADGHVHVYGRLRGRALAGARGAAEARVFCQSLEAELISVNGEFLTADDIPTALRGKPAQVFVENGVVQVAPL